MHCALPGMLLAELSDFIAARMGLHFPQERWPDLERSLIAALPELGHADLESSVRWLLTATLTRTHIEILASYLTIGETYFFREKKSLEILETQIVPELLRARHAGERHLRIWSAGCCTGEEPYSIAILLDRLIPDQASWNITLLATDINPQFLRKAAEGTYSEWSFRRTPAWIKARYFKQRKDGRFELSAHIRNKVAFSYLNLADDIYPSLLNNTNAMDVIFCRNVLMYFTAQRAKAVVRNFHRALVKNGWLIVNPTETSANLFPFFAPVAFPGTVLYRKIEEGDLPGHASGTQPRTIRPAAPVFPVEAAQPLAPLQTTPPQAVPAAIMTPDDTHLRTPDELSLRARNCANQGRLDEAIAWCQQAIAVDKMNPARHYLLAAVQQELGQADAAAQSLNRALYLDSRFVLAHFALGNLRLSQDRRREAERHFTNTLAALRDHPHEAILPESEGLAAGRLVEIVASVLAGLPGTAATGTSGEYP